MGILGGLSGWEIGVIEGDGRWWRGRVGGCVVSFGCLVSGGVLICSFGVCFENVWLLLSVGNGRGFEWSVQEYEIWLHRGLNMLLEKQKSGWSYNIKD